MVIVYNLKYNLFHSVKWVEQPYEDATRLKSDLKGCDRRAVSENRSDGASWDYRSLW